MDAFAAQKRQVLLNLRSGLDFSPKGCLDAPVADLVHLINLLPAYFTTSSCSGRISVYHSTGDSNKGVNWLLVRHGTVLLESVRATILEAATALAKPKWLMLKCEPCILHVCCLNLDSAQQLLSVAVASGFRESGITYSATKVMVAIRTTSFNMDVPLALHGKLIVEEGSLTEIVSEVNDHLIQNFERIQRVLSAVKDHFHYPAFTTARLVESEPSISMAQWNGSLVACDMNSVAAQCAPVQGHQLCLRGTDGQLLLLHSGGRAGVRALPCLRVLDAKSGAEIRVQCVGSVPRPRWGHVFVSLGGGRFALIGGRDEQQVLPDAFLVTVNVTEEGPRVLWEKLWSDESFARVHSAACALPFDADDSGHAHMLVLYGGLRSLDDLHGDASMTLVNLSACSARPVHCPWLPRRHTHSLVALPGQCLCCFGGVGDDGEAIWIADFGREAACALWLKPRSAQIQGELPCSACRVNHHMWWDSAAQQIHISGGSSVALAFSKHNCCSVALRVYNNAASQPAASPAGGVTDCALVTSKQYVKRLKTFLETQGWLDKAVRISAIRRDDVTGPPLDGDLTSAVDDLMRLPLLAAFAQRVQQKDFAACEDSRRLREASPLLWLHRGPAVESPRASPRERATQWLLDLAARHGLPRDAARGVPTKYEVVGDVLMIPDSALADEAWQKLIAELGCERFWAPLASLFRLQRVAVKRFIDSGPMRVSRSTLVLNQRALGANKACACGELHNADEGWVTVAENGIRFSFDLSKVMFCSGNNTERMRMGGLHVPDEVVVDLYAGVGYYTLPLLVHGGAQALYACEWNPQSLRALRHNLAVAHVADRCTVVPGDNQLTGPTLANLADRVLLGLLPSSAAGWWLAAKVLKPSGGMVHVHENVFEPELQQWIARLVKDFEALLRAEGKALRVHVQHVETVKSYAPRVSHFVVDLRCHPESS